MARPRRNRSSVAPATVAAPVRCAIYCRKSTDAGLDQEFNSLDAQREACESYVASYRHEGWVAVPTEYSDGGFSGATVERPGLKRLLADIEAGLIETVVVYKFDRLSRSMLDFLQLLNLFKRHGVSFVSVSQRFDTSTPVGEMTLNVLLSFAQFERQIIAERTRDKMHAARRRGRWTGGRPILGFDTDGGKLVVNAAEAEQVRAIFGRYVESPSLVAVATELNRRGWRQKRWTTKGGDEIGGGAWNKPSLRTLLRNPLYAGLQKLHGETFRGEHPAIVDRKLFDQVQSLLQQNRATGGATQRNTHGFLLRGVLRCAACDTAMVPSATRKGSRSYKYYRCSHAEKAGHASCPTKSVNADRVEQFVVDQLRQIGSDPALQAATFDAAVAQVKAERRGLRAEQKRLERDREGVRGDLERLVATLSRTDGPAADAVAGQVNAAQERLGTVEARLGEIADGLAALKAQEIDRDAVAAALADFDEIWSVLLVPERERVLRLVLDRVTYDGRTQEMKIDWRLAGFGQLAAEVAS